MMKTCERCNREGGKNSFLRRSLYFPRVCKECLTDEELHSYIVSPLTKAMKGVRRKDKPQIIRDLFNAHKRKRQDARNV